VSVKST